MSDTLNQILAVIRSIKDDERKLEQVLGFLEEKFVEDFDFKTIGVPERFKLCVVEIADSIEAGLVCFLNPETLEIDSYPQDLLHEIDLFDDPKEVKENLLDLYDWEDIKVLDWDKYFEFSPPDSNEGFRIMEAFAERLKEDEKLQNRLIRALNNRKPFVNFNDIIHNSDYRQKWFDFKQQWLENFVAARLLKELGL
ncbi:hypothetical protein SDC9_180180 [bioreactor metagenome]|mgnify:CR=1 FL=1|uniref:Uncharacterized protein n=1 Tax=bioreactor metagenome TaxID=1076179 RepID=A0A645H211_9ZZZZ|nr:MAG: hypothetical protein BGO33_12865 [Bacteroidia bacterium 43-41]